MSKATIVHIEAASTLAVVVSSNETLAALAHRRPGGEVDGVRPTIPGEPRQQLQTIAPRTIVY
ncbi:hypothetical protein H6M51_12400 [Rhizobium sp. AQ_MP]|uniref:hypothetical protein n=1 Tax=Rhizobium sp. AQ_MP TaxID=2761536 RepID=UPI00163B4453|nr:hypothetical protein [Rhizobium sp. AQ_MP]MBC2773667.1 hypothetical protein [Rhizobium sp. AQ_MP]